MNDEIDDRFDLLLSAALDDELDADEREELERLLAQDPSLAGRAEARRSEFAAADSALRSLSLSGEERDMDAGLLDLRSRLAPPSDALAASAGPSRARGRGWLVPLAAAAALALYFWGTGSDESPLLAPPGVSPLAKDGSTDVEGTGLEEIPGPGEGADGYEPLALALLFEIQEELLEQGLEGTANGQALDVRDLEVIEQLDLMEFLSARNAGGRG